MKFFTLVALLTLSFLTAAQSYSDKAFFARTETPILLDKTGGISYAMTEKEYLKLMAQMNANPNLISIRRKPSKLSQNARFGFNVVIGSKNIGWILDGDEKRGFAVYADWNADGDLANESPIKLRKIGDEHLFRKNLTETIDGKSSSYEFRLKLRLEETIPPGETKKTLVLKTFDGTSRRGVVNVGTRAIAFELFGSGGIYNGKYNNLYFDLDGDGAVDMKTRYSPESYKIPEKYVNIGDATYEFSVDRYGETLTLKRLVEKLPARTDLRVGNNAPDFLFKDLDGNERRLSDFRGKIVLLDFWGLWCAPCIAEAPNLAAAYQKLKENGFEVVSFDEGDTPENLRKFINLKKMTWTHAQTDETLKKLYRIDRYPTYFLLDPDGKIISNTLRPGEELYKKVEEMLKNQQQSKN